MADDLADLDKRLLSRAHAVVAVRDMVAGCRDRDVVVMRHDVDNGTGALEAAVSMAQWEADRGYRSSYYLLHTAAYWRDGRLDDAALTIAACGHEIGIHTNAIADALRTGDDPDEILLAAIAQLRELGLQIVGTVGHGDQLCRKDEANFNNADQFVECKRQAVEPERTLTHDGVTVKLRPRPLDYFGLRYEAAFSILPTRGHYNTDSNGRWLYPFDDTVADFETSRAGAAGGGWQSRGPTVLLVHPDWWTQAFAPESVDQERIAA